MITEKPKTILKNNLFEVTATTETDKTGKYFVIKVFDSKHSRIAEFTVTAYINSPLLEGNLYCKLESTFKGVD